MEFNDWKKVKLEEIIELNPRLSIKKEDKAKKVAMDKLGEFARKIKGFEITEFKGGSKFQNGDTLLARITPCLENGKTAYVNILNEKETAFGSTEFFVLRAKEGVADPKFVYYLSISEEVRNVVIQSMTGTSGRQRAQKESLLNFEKHIPNIKVQRQISSILSSLDDKIEINNEIVNSIEEFAQTLFNRWFLDYEFPNEYGESYKSSGGEMQESEVGLIPLNWNVKKLGDLPIFISDHVANGSFASLKANVNIHDKESFAIFLRNVDLKSDLNSSVRYVDENSYNFLNKTQLFGDEVIISNVADVGTVHRCPKLDKPMVLGNNQIYLNSKEYPLELNTFFYLYFKSSKGQHQIETITSGSAQMKFNKTDFRNLKVVLPAAKDFEKIDFLLLKKTLDYIDTLKSEIKLTINLRNTLLPKLLSGEIELPEEIEVTEHVSIS